MRNEERKTKGGNFRKPAYLSSTAHFVTFNIHENINPFSHSDTTIRENLLECRKSILFWNISRFSPVEF
jgi:hypothetical protein